MGALEHHPENKARATPAASIAIDSLVEMAQAVLNQRADLYSSIKPNEEDPLLGLLQVGTSAGGARAKAVIAINKSRSVIKSGQVKAPKGYEHFLLKFDGVEEQREGVETFGDLQGYGRAEYAYFLMAKDCGINISHCELLEENGRAHFMTKRFDRVGNDKVHYVSLCAMAHANYRAPGHYSYEELIQLSRDLKLEKDDAIEIFRRMVFNVVARNHDDHTKNFGFLYDPNESSWNLAPAFDLAYSYKPNSPWVQSHQLSLGTKQDEFSKNDLVSVYSVINSDKKTPNKIIKEVMDVVSEWESYAEKAQVRELLMQKIKNNLRLYF
jgi:serine/threonine-protein kinase HipA